MGKFTAIQVDTSPSAELQQRVDSLKRRLRIKQLSLEQVRLASFLGDPAARIIAPDFPELPPVSSAKQWLWNIVEFGRSVQLWIAYFAMLRVHSQWSSQETPCVIDLSKRIDFNRIFELTQTHEFATALEAKDWQALSPSSMVLQQSNELSNLMEELENLSHTLVDLQNEQGTYEQQDDLVDMFSCAINVLGWKRELTESEITGIGPIELNWETISGAAKQALNTLENYCSAVDLRSAELQLQLRDFLVPILLNSHWPEVQHRPARQMNHLVDFATRQQFSPDSVYVHCQQGWRYIPVHPFADDEDLAHTGVQPEQCQSCDAYWLHGDRMCLIEIAAKTNRYSKHAYGFFYRWKHCDPTYDNLIVNLNLPFLTRQTYETCMSAWNHIRSTVKLADGLSKVPVQFDLRLTAQNRKSITVTQFQSDQNLDLDSETRLEQKSALAQRPGPFLVNSAEQCIVLLASQSVEDLFLDSIPGSFTEFERVLVHLINLKDQRINDAPRRIVLTEDQRQQFHAKLAELNVEVLIRDWD